MTNSDGTLWLDNSAQHDGEPWLNPYSPVAEKYLLSIVSEISSLGVDAVILDSVEFPESIYLDKAVFSGEEKSIESRNAVLHSFIEKVKKRARRQAALRYAQRRGRAQRKHRPL